MALRARPVDPRDITWEEHEPVFRVHLYSRSTAGAVLTPDELANQSWSASEWEITGADVAEVLAWADEHVAVGDLAEISVVVGGRDTRGVIRLCGHDPNARPLEAPTRAP